MKRFDQYIEEVLKKLDCSKEEKADMYLEFLDHLNELKNEYIRSGKSSDEAIQCAMDDFGNKKTISEEMNKSVSRVKGLLSRFLKFTWWIYSFNFVMLFLRPLMKFRYPTRMVSLVPFKTITTYLFGKTPNFTYQLFHNILGNIFLFVPFAFLLPICFSKGRTLKESFLYSFLLSTLVELYQFTFRVGVLDVDDVILNVIGGIIGYIVYKLTIKWLHKTEKSYLLM